MFWHPSIPCCIPIELEGKGGSNFGGPYLAKGSLMLGPFL